jgi:hypothetical protein
MDEVDWKAAYQFEHEEHKKTVDMLNKTMEESNQVFFRTRDMIRFLEEITEQGAPPQPAPTSSTSSRRYRYD